MKRYLLIPSTLELPPIITTMALGAARQGSPYSFTMAATSGVAPYSWTATGLPTGITLSTAGVFMGTPTVPGTSSVTITCTDTAGNFTIQVFSLVVAVSSLPQITTTMLNAAPQGTPFSQTLAVSGGQSPYVWSATTTLPAGMTFSSAGVLQGTPLNSGTTAITFNVTDSFENSATATLSFVVTPVVVTNSNVIKWFPGHKMLSNGVDNSNGSYNATEISYLKAAYASNPGLLNGYALQFTWSFFYSGNSPTPNFSVLAPYLAAVWAAVPACPVTIMVAAYANWRAPFSSSAGNSIVPGFIYNGSTATYGVPDIGGSGAGWLLTGYGASAPTDYDYVNANLSNANVKAAWDQFFVQLLEWTGAQAVNGVSYPINSHPWIEAVGDWGPDDIEANNSPTLSPSYNGEQWMVNFRNRATVIAAAPNCTFFIMPGYGANKDNGANDELPTVTTMQSQRVAQSCTDVFYNDNNSPNPYGSDLTYAQNFAVGNSNAGTQSNPSFVQGGGTALIGPNTNKNGSFPNVQGYDYQSKGKNTNYYTAGKVEGIGAVAIKLLGANSIYWNCQLNNTSGGGWNGYVLPGIIAIGALPAANQDIPLNYMVAPMVPTQIATTPPSFSWPTVEYITTYQVYRNGTAIGTVTSTGATAAFTDSTETTPGTYLYTVACANSNGIGPQSASLSITVPAVPTVYYQYSNGVFDFTNWPAVNDYSAGIVGAPVNGVGGGTEDYTDTTHVQGGHQYAFKMVCNSPNGYGLWQPASNWGVSPYGFDLSKYTQMTVKICAGQAGMDFNCYCEYAAESDEAVSTSVQSLKKIAGSFPALSYVTVNIPLSSLGVIGQKHFFKRAVQFQVGGQPTAWLDDVGYITGVYSMIESGAGSINSPWSDASVNATMNYNVVPTSIGSGGTQPVSLAGPNNPTGVPTGTRSSLAYCQLTVTATGGMWKATCAAGFDTTPYSHFFFGAQPSRSPYGYIVKAYDISGNVLGSVTIAAGSSLTLNDNGVSAQSWTVYNILTSALGAANTKVYAISIQDNSGLGTNSILMSMPGWWG